MDGTWTLESIARMPSAPELEPEPLLDAVLAEAATTSISASSLDAIAARAGTTTATIRDRYPDLRVLMVDALRRRDELGAAQIAQGPRDGRALLQGFLATAQANTAAPGAVELFATLSAAATSADHPGHEYFRQRYASLRHLLVDALRELEEEGELAEHADPVDIATQTIALLDGLQVQWLLDRGSLDMAALVRTFLDVWVLHPLAIDA
ncbi:TetR family transcriptional regulator C-terminal domain-containing protein [Demequina capsici]|uniref:TetR family transcriptional regulator C-terminal domain-containing protein n=1 Tax=Demequina capsici TaxID=3075620 RepID=A0AA96FDK5_9MICO|nr:MULTISPECIES: TetR family transcriptional regulator C-terminal domain-containing protein [unclassified Demequina]WNM24656.1 TetR family transcriptional regulator C-terminal domain-containing protein [Demequina sp. OYTSA14]WNM27505.1 TetR family transcriptional regulator C-terminal domain-containing protein [Demequina sp. PMTSA13]